MLICLKYESSLQLEKQKKERQQNPQNRQQLNIFWHKVPAHHQSKWEGESRSEEGSTTPELLTVFQVLHMATAILAGVGCRGHLRRISETGKVTKSSLE